MARPSKPHHCSWDNKPVPGLYKCHDGRWRIRSGDKYVKFTATEQEAVARVAMLNPPATIALPLTSVDAANQINDAVRTAGRREIAIDVPLGHTEQIVVQRVVTSAEFWAKVTEELTYRSANAARMTGIAALARLPYIDGGLPKAAIRLTELIKHYKASNPSGPKAKRRTVAVFEAFAAFTGAKILDDLTTERLLEYRQSIETSKTVLSGGTRKWMFGQVKVVIAFGLKVGLDERQIGAALDRCKVLWTATPDSPVDPKPISRDDFHKLLNAAGDDWRAWLLMGLNCACYIEELRTIRWAEIDLERGTYATIRNKTKADRIPRAATLWPETIAALKALRRGPVHVFTSKLGVAYTSSASRCNKFAKLRTKANVDVGVGFASLKDGAYTIACQHADDRLARVLAGHKLPGLQDNYVLRHPEMVRPACDAVYKAFGPFPKAS